MKRGPKLKTAPKLNHKRPSHTFNSSPIQRWWKKWQRAHAPIWTIAQVNGLDYSQRHRRRFERLSRHHGHNIGLVKVVNCHVYSGFHNYTCQNPGLNFNIGSTNTRGRRQCYKAIECGERRKVKKLEKRKRSKNSYFAHTPIPETRASQCQPRPSQSPPSPPSP